MLKKIYSSLLVILFVLMATGCDAQLTVIKPKEEIITVESRMRNLRIEIRNDKAGEPRFTIMSSNGRIFVTSEGYSSKKACLDSFESLRKHIAAGKFKIIDFTEEQK